MSIDWLFEIDETYYFSTRAITYSGQVYTPIVIDNSFNGIQENRIKTEMDSLTKSTFSFELENKTYTYSSSDFDGKTVIVRRLINSTETNSWKFIVKTSDPQYKTITLNCEDYLSYLSDGLWPTTQLVKDVFPEATVRLDPNSDALYSDSDKICIPVVFGTAYIPLHSVSDGTSTPFLVLGESTPTYTVTEVKSPHDDDEQTTYTPGATYTISQSTINSTAVFQLLEDGDPLFWNSGAKRLKPLVEFSRSDTSTLYNVVDIIKYIIKDWGAVDADFDSTTWAAASAEITSRGLQYHKGFYKHESRKDILVNLLTIADAHLRIGETIEIYMNSATPADTITSSDIIKSSLNSDGTFKVSRSVPNTNDSGIIEFASFGLPEDLTTEKTVPIGATVLNPVTNKLNLIGVTSNILAQSIGTLYYQRSLTKNSTLSFTGNASLYTLRPGQMIGFDNNLYGGTYSALIDSIKFNKNSTIEFNCTTFSITLDDWGDISPGAVTLYSTPAFGTTTLSKAKDYADSIVGADGFALTWYSASTSDPSDTWDGTDASHEGDWWYTTDTEKSYRWSGLAWVEWTDADIIQALSDASDAQDTADGKRRVFVVEPTTPYDLGDLWANSTVLYRCSTARASGAYVSGDWTRTADNTVDNGQAWDWITGTKPDQNADVTQAQLDLGADIQNTLIGATALISGAYFNNLLIQYPNSATPTALAYADIITPTTLGVTSPTGTGVFMNNTYIGYVQTGSVWTYIRNNGDFRFYQDSNNYISNTGGSLTAQFDSIDIKGGQTLNISSTGKINVAAISGIEISSAYGIDILTGGSLRVAAGSIDITSTGKLNVTAASGIVIGTLGTMEVNAVGGLNVNALSGVTVKNGGGITVQSGGKVELQSSSDSTNMLSFKNTATSRYFDFYPSDSGQALLIKPRAAYSGGSGIFIGDTTNTSVATISSYTRLELYCGSNVDFKLYPTYAALNVPGTNYDFTFSATGLYPGTPMACGTAAAPWSGVGTNSLYVYGTASITGTATMAAINASGTINFTGGTYTRIIYTYNHEPRAANTYDSGATYRWRRLYSEYVIVGGASYNSAHRLRIKGSGTTSSTYGIIHTNSSSANRFWVNDAGQVYCLAGVWYTSAKEEKKDIVKLSDPVLGKVLKLSPSKFKLRQHGDEAKDMSGFITEEVEPLFPDLVRHFEMKDDGFDEDGKKVREPKTNIDTAMNYSGIIPYNTKAIQEHQEYIDSIGDRTEDLELQIIKLTKLVENLTKKT